MITLHNKLVRDLEPVRIKQRNVKAVVRSRQASDQEFCEYLKVKLLETASVFMHEPTPGNFVDIMDVLDAVQYGFAFDLNVLDAIQEQRYRQEGDFTRGIILESVSE